TPLAASHSESRIAFEEEFVPRSGVALRKIRGWDRCAITESAVLRRHCSAYLIVLIGVLVIQLTKPVGQSECARSEPDAQRIREPFGQKKNAGLAVRPDVSANVEKAVRGDWFEEPFAQPSADAWPHSQQGEGDDADKHASFIQVELKGN